MSTAQITHSTDEILGHLCRTAAQAVGGLAAEVALWDDAEKQLIIRAFSGPPPPVRAWAIGDGTLGRTWREPKPTLASKLDDLEPEALGFATSAGADAVFIVPIINPKRILGLLLVFRRGNTGQVWDDIDLLGLFAQHAANALENAELAARQQALADNLAAARRELEAETARRQAAEAALGQMEARYAVLVRNSPAGIALARLNEEQKFRGLLESAPDAMVIGDRDGNINLVNSQTEKLFGYTRAELLGQPMDMLVPKRFHVPHPDQRIRYLGEPRITPFGTGLDLYGLRKDGTEFPVEISLNPLETEDALLVITVIRDATERRLFEQALGDKNAELEKASLLLGDTNVELERASLLLNDKNVELEKASLAKDRFLASMSHELRTPLNAVLGFTGTLLMRLPGPLTPDQEKQLQTIRTSARHLLSLINDLLDLAKIESGKVELSIELVGCRAVMDEVIAALRPLAEAKRLQLTADYPPQDVVLQTDRRALSQIVINLTNNAIKFTEAGQVRLALSQSPDSGRLLTEIRVEDTGIGMQPADQAKLFQAFEQLASSGARRYEGTGLGLYLSQRLAGLLGGRIEFESRPGHGSIFKLLIREP